MLIEWNDARFSVGIRGIDEHHKYLIKLLNELYIQVGKGTSKDHLEAVLDELLDYATYHLDTEERMMTLTRYPEAEGHKKEHERFMRRVNEMRADFHGGRKALSLELVAFLLNWFTSHISQLDAEFGRHITDTAKIAA